MLGLGIPFIFQQLDIGPTLGMGAVFGLFEQVKVVSLNFLDDSASAHELIIVVGNEFELLEQL